MAGHVDDIDIELFIGEIKNYPGIWNVASENYHDRTQKRAAWVSVCRVFFENFDEKEDTEKNEICKYNYSHLLMYYSIKMYSTITI